MIPALRSAAFAAAFYAVTAVIGLLALPLLAAPPSWLRPPLRLWARATVVLLRLCCGIRVRLTGAEHLPSGGAALLAARHESAFDTLVWLALLPHPAYVLKQELLRIPVYGWHARHYGMIPVDRTAGASAMRALLRGARAAATAGMQVVIFPEGSRIAPGVRVPFQPGIAALATALGLPVVPVATDSGRCWGRGLLGRRAGTIAIAVLPPLPAGLPRAALMVRLEAVIGAEQDRLEAAAAVDISVDSGARPGSAGGFAARKGR